MAYEVYLGELKRLVAGQLLPETAVKISVRRSYIGASSFEFMADDLTASSLTIAVFDATATKGSKALVVVPVRPHEEVDDIEDGTAAVATGVLQPGRAVALRIGDRTLAPAGPATRPVFRIPKL